MTHYLSVFRGLAVALFVTVFALAAHAESDSQHGLGALWWQWALSIPSADNPLLDATGAKCMVGQRGETWFLAGTFGGGAAVRTCSVPQGTKLFFPVANFVNFDTPNVCGQGPERIPLRTLREASAASADSVAARSVMLDGKPIDVRRIKSKVFALALPEDNIFDPLCAPLNVPAGIFSPAVDEGFYALLDAPSIGVHTLRVLAKDSAGNVLQDVTYTLDVVRTLLK